MANTDYLIVSPADIPGKLLRMFEKIHIDLITGCWNWTGSKDQHGYGHAGYKGRVELSHRLMYACLISPIPRGRAKGIPVLDHVVCDNTSCCNPDHVQLVMNEVNIARSEAASTINRRKTHCIHGHEFSPTDTNGRRRICHTCARHRRAKYRARHT
jgi:hypothetical protein